MTNQEAFDEMMNHLRNLKGRSEGPNGSCVYNGKRCAIGALMTDKEQTVWGGIDGGVARLVTVMSAKGHRSLLHGLDLTFLDIMQDLHDTPHHWDDNGNFNGEGTAQEIANLYNLTYTGV